MVVAFVGQRLDKECFARTGRAVQQNPAERFATTGEELRLLLWEENGVDQRVFGGVQTHDVGEGGGGRVGVGGGARSLAALFVVGVGLAWLGSRRRPERSLERFGSANERVYAGQNECPSLWIGIDAVPRNKVVARLDVVGHCFFTYSGIVCCNSSGAEGDGLVVKYVALGVVLGHGCNPVVNRRVLPEKMSPNEPRRRRMCKRI